MSYLICIQCDAIRLEQFENGHFSSAYTLKSVFVNVPKKITRGEVKFLI